MAKRRSSVERMLDSINDMSESDRAELTDHLVGASIDASVLVQKESKMVSMADFIDEVQYLKDKRGELVGESTGDWVVDRMTMGLAPGELTIVAAPTSVGKSLFCMNIAAHILKQDKMVGFITLEMTRAQLGDRMSSIMGWDEYTRHCGNLLVNGSTKMSWHSVDLFIEHCANAGATVVFIDHLHYFPRTGGSNNTAEQLGEITQAFKQAAIKHNVAVVLISHTRKLAEGKKHATSDDLRGSSFIAQDADIVLMLNRVKDMDHTLAVTLSKNRNRYGCKYGTEWHIELDGLKLIPTPEDFSTKSAFAKNL